MRTIKFRAWDQEQGKMFYDFEFGNGVGEFNINLQGDGTLIIGAYDSSEDYYELKPLLFTGVYTRPGDPLFEGDIIDCRDGTFEVKYIENFGKFVMERKDCIQDVDTCMRSMRILGNIYENPELLNKEASGEKE